MQCCTQGSEGVATEVKVWPALVEYPRGLLGALQVKQSNIFNRSDEDRKWKWSDMGEFPLQFVTVDAGLDSVPSVGDKTPQLEVGCALTSHSMSLCSSV